MDKDKGKKFLEIGLVFAGLMIISGINNDFFYLLFLASLAVYGFCLLNRGDWYFLKIYFFLVIVLAIRSIWGILADETLLNFYLNHRLSNFLIIAGQTAYLAILSLLALNYLRQGKHSAVKLVLFLFILPVLFGFLILL